MRHQFAKFPNSLGRTFGLLGSQADYSEVVGLFMHWCCWVQKSFSINPFDVGDNFSLKRTSVLTYVCYT